MRQRSHRPERTCLGCGERDLKASMARVGFTEDRLVHDPEGRLPGRGGYLHPRAGCLDAFVRRKVKRFRSFGREVKRAERSTIAQTLSSWLDSRANDA